MKRKACTYLLLAVLSLVIVGCTSPTRYGRSTGEYIDDKTIAGDVKGTLKDDSLLSAAPIRVESFRGHVHLTGFVDHPVQKERASELARRVAGVKWFKNDIVVKSQLPESGVAAAGTRIREPAGAERPENGEMRMQMNNGNQPSGGTQWQEGTDPAKMKDSETQNPGIQPEEQEYRSPRSQ